ncbi:MAG: hypothetical protein Q4B50_07850 [Bacillota bacterium]|nr:hypothetical protein [Bacillota bacterium]
MEIRSIFQQNDVAILALSLLQLGVPSGLPRCQAGFCQGKITACLPRNDRNQKQHPNTKVLWVPFFQERDGFKKKYKPFFFEKKKQETFSAWLAAVIYAAVQVLKFFVQLSFKKVGVLKEINKTLLL